jgi:DNA-binding CsgD family transcriptional regulator
MRKQKLLQRLVGGLATNEGVQPKRTEIWQRLKSLTPREVDVLCYILGGQFNREIAAELGIAVRTIKHHRGRVMEKLGVQSTAQLFPMVLRYIARLAEIQTPPQEVQRATPGESVGFAPERIRRFRTGIWAMDAALVAEKKDDFGNALQNLYRELERAEKLVGPG